MIMKRIDRLKAKMQADFRPERLEVIDDSALHAGHAGATMGGETHYRIIMTSPIFAGQSRVSRSRAVHQALAAEFDAGLHALSLTLRAPGEA